MECRQLNKFIQEHNLTHTPKLIKYLVLIGIHTLKQKTKDISEETIKLIASMRLSYVDTCKDHTLKNELNSLRNKVMSLEKHLNLNDQYHSQPKITQKITQQIPPMPQLKKVIPCKHHLDDSEIKSILWNQFEQQQENPQPKIQRNNSQSELPSGYTTQRDIVQSYRQNSQRSSHSSQQGERNSPKFREETKRLVKSKENRQPESQSNKSLPKHLKRVESKIKEQVKQDKIQHKIHPKIEAIDDKVLNITNSSLNPLNPLNTTPQNKYFQPCQSTHFGCNMSSGQLKINLDNNQIESTERRMNMQEIANNFLNSPFMKSQVKQRLFRQSNAKESGHSSISSNFSLFNPNNELKNFFQKEYLVQNSISFQF